MGKTVDDEVPEHTPPRAQRNLVRTNEAHQIVVGQGRRREPIVVHKPSDGKNTSPDTKDSQESDD